MLIFVSNVYNGLYIARVFEMKMLLHAEYVLYFGSLQFADSQDVMKSNAKYGVK